MNSCDHTRVVRTLSGHNVEYTTSEVDGSTHINGKGAVGPFTIRMLTSDWNIISERLQLRKNCDIRKYRNWADLFVAHLGADNLLKQLESQVPSDQSCIFLSDMQICTIDVSPQILIEAVLDLNCEKLGQ